MKMPMMRARAGAQRAQDGDVGFLVGHRHHQRGHEVEGRHRDDQRQDDEHQPFFSICTARKKLAWLRVQSAHQQAVASTGCRSSRATARRLVQVGQLQLHAGDAVRPCGTAGRRRPGGSAPGRCRIHSAGVEGADHSELLEPRQDRRPASPAPAARSASRLSPVRTRSCRASSAPSTMPNSPGCSWPSRPPRHVRGQAASPSVPQPGQTPRTMAPRTSVAEGEHALLGDEGRGRHHLRGSSAPARHGACQSASSLPCRRDLHMRGHAEDARAHFLLEAVHHRQHDDQRRHAQRDAAASRPAR
jgi:hypothetical protein